MEQWAADPSVCPWSVPAVAGSWAVAVQTGNISEIPIQPPALDRPGPPERLRSTFAWNTTSRLITASSMPTVGEEQPSDQNSYRQYTYFTRGSCWRISRLVVAVIVPTMEDAAHVGGIIVTTCA